jgi:hypothetical protein
MTKHENLLNPANYKDYYGDKRSATLGFDAGFLGFLGCANFYFNFNLVLYIFIYFVSLSIM